MALRFTRRWGPHRIATTWASRARRSVGCWPATGCRSWRTSTRPPGCRCASPAPMRYEAAAPGELVHVDIKKLGRIPDGGGWRVHGRGSAQDRRPAARGQGAPARGAPGSRGYGYLHHAVDDHSRLAYSEILDDERKETAAGFWARANAFFADLGITVTAVMTDNGACYRSHAFAARSATASSTTDPALPTADQREGRTLQPHPRRRMGLRPALPLRRTPAQPPTPTGCILQSPPTPHRHRRPRPLRPRSQPHGELHSGCRCRG